MTDKKSSNKFLSYNCNECNYNTVRKSQFERHLLTTKHKLLTNTYKKVPKSSQKVLNKKQSFICNCGKAYFHRQSLYNHQSKCRYLNDCKNEIIEEPEDNDKLEKQAETPVIEPDLDYKNMFIELIKQNADFKSLIIEQQKENQTLQKQLIDVVKEGKNINSNNTILHIFCFLILFI